MTGKRNRSRRVRRRARQEHEDNVIYLSSFKGLTERISRFKKRANRALNNAQILERRRGKLYPNGDPDEPPPEAA